MTGDQILVLVVIGLPVATACACLIIAALKGGW